MTDCASRQAEINRAVFQALAAALELEPTHPETSFRIRRAFVNPAPPPAPPDQDVLFYHLAPEEGPPLTETAVREEYADCFHFSAFRLNLVFYGPNAESLAWQVRRQLFLDGAGNPRRILRQQGIYPIPASPSPSLSWEEWQKEHRPRADLTIFLRIANRISVPAWTFSTAESPPEIVLRV